MKVYVDSIKIPHFKKKHVVYVNKYYDKIGPFCRKKNINTEYVWNRNKYLNKGHGGLFSGNLFGLFNISKK